MIDNMISSDFELLFASLTKEDRLANKLIAYVANLLAVERQKKDLSQKDFATLLGVSQPMVSKWESGEYNFSLENIAKLACKLSLEVELNIKTKAAEAESSEWEISGMRGVEMASWEAERNDIA